VDESEAVVESVPDHFRIAVGGSCKVVKVEVGALVEGPAAPRYLCGMGLFS